MLVIAESAEFVVQLGPSEVPCGKTRDDTGYSRKLFELFCIKSTIVLLFLA